jgi:hypothetical protein
MLPALACLCECDVLVELPFQPSFVDVSAGSSLVRLISSQFAAQEIAKTAADRISADIHRKINSQHSFDANNSR